MKINLQDTRYAQSLAFGDQVKVAAKFLAANAGTISLSQKDLHAIKAIRPLSESHMSEMFRHIVTKDLLDKFYLMDLSKLPDAPEILSSTLPVIGEHYGLSGQLAYPWINVQPALGIRGRKDDPINIVDSNRIMSMIVGSTLSLSYNSTDEWLTPKIIGGFAGIFGVSVALRLSSIYQFGTEFTIIAAIIAYYFSNKCYNDKRYVNMSLGYLLGPFNAKIVSEIRQRIEDKDLAMDSLDDLADALRIFGPERIGNLTAGTLYRLIGKAATMNTDLYIAADYPPMYMTIVLRHAYEKVSIISSLITSKLIKKQDISKLLDLLLSHKNMYRSVAQL